MTTLAAPLLLGFIGAVLGFFIPSAACRISLYKCLAKKIECKIDSRYTFLVVKLAALAVNAGAWAVFGLKTGNPLIAVFVSLIFTLSVIIAIIDLQIRLIPNELVLALLVLGLIFQITYFGKESLPSSILTMFGMMLIFSVVAGAMGFGKVGAGDVKLAGAIGLTLGYPNILTALIVLAALIVIYCSIGLATKRLTLRSMFPFAPFMMAGTVSALICAVFGYPW